MKSALKIFPILLLFFLSSCTLTLQSFLDVFNYSKNSADAVSYIATEKTTTDHALSYIFNKDCSLARTLTLKQICQEINKSYSENPSHLNKNLNKVNNKKKVVKLKKRIKVPSMAYEF